LGKDLPNGTVIEIELKEIARLDGEYLNWVIYEGDFSDPVKQVVREAVKP